MKHRLLLDLLRDPIKAHQTVFTNEFPSPAFHSEIVQDLHGLHPRTVDEAFRGAAKSTLAEQAIAIRMACGLFSYGLLLGNTYGAAAQRLAAIRSIIDNNRVLHRLFGDLHGPVWNEGKIKLANGSTLAAIGARSSIRGFKEDSARPDWVLLDDLEDEEWVKDPDAIEANKLWLFREIIPALASPETTPIRMIGTPLAENSMLRQLAASEEWQSRRFPIRYLDEAGEPVSAWPEKFSLPTVDKIEKRYVDLGAHRAFMQEYMCESESESERVFTASMLRTEPRVRTWQAVYAMIDPARTTKKTSAQTGRAVWSWSAGGRLDIWECGGAYQKPDEIISEVFRINEKYKPVEIGVEEDGLNEWLMQPIRDAQVRSGVIPVIPVRAPRGKVDFIKGLQPFLKAGTAMFCEEPGDAAGKFSGAFSQFLAFPRGVIDAPNALAYAMTLRPGVPVYPDFSPECVEASSRSLHGRAAVLAMNADGSRVTALLLQDQSGVSQVLGEWVEEGNAGDVVQEIVRSASIEAPGPLVVVIGREHLERYRNFGLNQALQRANIHPRVGGDVQRGRAEIQALLRKRLRGTPAIMVSDRCRFALNGLSAGFAYPVEANVVASEPKKGIYRTLLEGLETFVASAIVADEDQEVGNWQQTSDGRRYRSAMRK